MNTLFEHAMKEAVEQLGVRGRDVSEGRRDAVTEINAKHAAQRICRQNDPSCLRAVLKTACQACSGCSQIIVETRLTDELQRGQTGGDRNGVARQRTG